MTVVGNITLIAKIDTSNYKKGVGEIKAGNQSIEQSGAKTGSAFNNTLSSMAKVGVAALAAAAAAAAAIIVSNIGGAVNRVDRLNNFPKVMSNMGISMRNAEKARDSLAKGLDGLPTSLDTATQSVQRLTTKTGDVGKATDLFLALNNAVLAGGAPMELQASALEQFAQSFAKGKPDMMEWRSLMAAMPAQLQQVAKDMGLASPEALGEGLRTGAISMEEFSNSIVKLNKEGTSGLPNFAEQAKNATDGIGTAFTRMNTAVQRGIAEIINAVGAGNVSAAISGFGAAFENGLKGISGFIKENRVLAESLGIAIVGIGAAFILASVGVAIFGAVMAVVTHPLFLIAAAVAVVVAGLVWLERTTGVFSAAWESLQAAMEPVINWFKSDILPVLQQIGAFIAGQFIQAWNSLKTAFTGLMTTLTPLLPVLKVIGALFLVGLVAPIAIVVVAILAVIAVVTALVTAFNWLWGITSTVFGFIWNVISTVFNAIVAVYNATLGPVISLIGTVIQAMFTIVVTILTALATVWFAIFQGILKVVSSVFNGIWGVISPILNRIWGFIAPILARIANVFSTTFNNIKNFVSDAFNNISQFVTKFVNVGKDVIEGIKKGITGGADMVKNAVLDIAKGAEKAIKNFFGIKSPSRMFADIGNYLMQGLAGGINKGSGAVQNAMGAVNSSLLGSLSPSISPLTPSTMSTIDSANHTPAGSGIVNNIGTINVASDVDAERLLQKLTNNSEVISKGLTPTRSYL